MKVRVEDITWEYYEGSDYDEEYGEGNDKGWPDCDCPRGTILELNVSDDASDDDIDEAIYNKLVDDVGNGWIPDYGNWYWEKA